MDGVQNQDLIGAVEGGGLVEGARDTPRKFPTFGVKANLNFAEFCVAEFECTLKQYIHAIICKFAMDTKSRTYIMYFKCRSAKTAMM